MNRKDSNSKKLNKRDKVVKPQGKSIFSMFGKGKDSRNDDIQSISDISQSSMASSESYMNTGFENDDMLSFIKDYDSKKSNKDENQMQNSPNIPVATQGGSGAMQQSYNSMPDMSGNELSMSDTFSSGASFGGAGTDSVFGNLGEQSFSDFSDMNSEENNFHAQDMTNADTFADFNQHDETLNSGLEDFTSNEIEETQSADYSNNANDDIYAMLNTSSHIDTPDGLMSDIQETQIPGFDFETDQSQISNETNIDEFPITDKIDEFYSNSVSDTQDVDNYSDVSEDVHMESSIDLDKYLEEFDKVDEQNETYEHYTAGESDDTDDTDDNDDSDDNDEDNDDNDSAISSSKETEEERLKRIREKRKRRKERKKEKIRKYIEEGKKVEERANSSLVVTNSDDNVFGGIEHFYSEKNENNGLKNENVDIQPRMNLSTDENGVSDSNIVNLEKMMKEQELKLERLQKELEEKSNLSDSKAGSQNDELFESVTKKQIQLLKKELELNSRENELKNKVLNVSSKDIAQYKFDSVKYNKSYDVETALKHYETDPKSAIEELRDMAIYSRSNKEYMVAYLALKKLINDNSEFLELIKEIETAKTKQKLEIERFISTLNVEKNKLL